MEPQDIVPLLQPLREPPAVSSWPPAPGWWLLAALLLLSVALAIAWVLRRRRRRAPLRAARRELGALQREAGNPAQQAARLSALWRRVALALADPAGDTPLASVTGEAWIAALNRLPGAEEAPLRPEWAGLAYAETIAPQDLETAVAGTDAWLSKLERRR